MLAKRQGLSRAELIRVAIDRYLTEPTAVADPLLELVGSAGPASRTDVSEHPDDVIYRFDGVALPMSADGESE